MFIIIVIRLTAARIRQIVIVVDAVDVQLAKRFLRTLKLLGI